MMNATRIRAKLDIVLTRDFLHQKYIIEGLSTPDIAAMTGASRGAVTNRMREYGIERRKRGFYSPCGENHHMWKGIGKLPQFYVTRLQFGAKARGHAFEIDAAFLWNLFEQQNGTCALTGVPLSLDSKNFTASVDRKDSTKGYTRGNVWWVHKTVNLAKQGSTTESFIEMCRAVAAHCC